MAKHELTPDEAQRAYDEAPVVPLSEERIQEIVDYATFDHPTDPANGRFLCSPEHPMPVNAPGRWSHTNAEEVHDSQENGWPSGDTVRMRCPDCGVTWRTELPQ